MGHAHAAPVTETGKPLSSSPEVMRPSLSGIKSRTSQLQYQPPQEMSPTSYSPVTNQSSSTYSGTGPHGTENYHQSTAFKRSNSDSMSRDHAPRNPMPSNRAQRHASFGFSDSKPAEFSRSPLQTNVGPYGLMSSAPGSQSYPPPHASPQGFVSQQNFPPFSLPPSGFSASTSTPVVSRETESAYPTSMPTDYPSDSMQQQQSGPDMMLLDQMTAPNTMPVFGGEGYNRSPFAIPEDFVAYLFSNQQLENASSPMSQMGHQGYTK